MLLFTATFLKSSKHSALTSFPPSSLHPLQLGVGPTAPLRPPLPRHKPRVLLYPIISSQASSYSPSERITLAPLKHALLCPHTLLGFLLPHGCCPCLLLFPLLDSTLAKGLVLSPLLTCTHFPQVLILHKTLNTSYILRTPPLLPQAQVSP